MSLVQYLKRLGLVAVFIVVVAMACLVGSMVYRQDGGEKSMAQSSLKFRKSPQKLNRETLAATILSGANNKSILDDSSNGICASKGVVLDKLNSLAAKPRTTRTRQAAVLLTDGTSTPFSPAPPMPVSGAC